MIDQEGIAILDAASRKAPIVIEQTVKDEEFTQLQMENESLKVKIMELQDQLINAQSRVTDLQDQLLQISQKSDSEPHRSWWQRLFKDKN